MSFFHQTLCQNETASTPWALDNINTAYIWLQLPTVLIKTCGNMSQHMVYILHPLQAKALGKGNLGRLILLIGIFYIHGMGLTHLTFSSQGVDIHSTFCTRLEDKVCSRTKIKPGSNLGPPALQNTGSWKSGWKPLSQIFVGVHVVGWVGLWG